MVVVLGHYNIGLCDMVWWRLGGEGCPSQKTGDDQSTLITEKFYDSCGGGSDLIGVNESLYVIKHGLLESKDCIFRINNTEFLFS